MVRGVRICTDKICGYRHQECRMFAFLQRHRQLAETIVFLEIRRRNPEVYYWKSKDGHEVDFVVKAGQKITERGMGCKG